MRHESVHANGADFHVARYGHGRPLVLLHGRPEFWLTWEPVMLRLGDAKVSLWVDADVLDWFKSQGKGHLTRMNTVLKSYAEAVRNDVG